MDEPTASLGAHEVDQVFRVVRRLRDQGRAVVYVTHRLDEVEELSDRITVLRDGRYIGTEDRADVTSRDQLVKLITGRSPSQLVRSGNAERGELMLQARGLTLAPKVRGVDLDLYAGEVTGIAGLVGSGRSEIAHMLAGVEKPQAGGVERFDTTSHKGAPVALLPEDRQGESAVPTMSIRENLTLASLGRWSRGPLTHRRRERRVVAEYVEKLQIKLRSAEAPITDLSGGNQQKVLLGKWLATGARIYVLDEPTQGVDVGAQEEIHVHIRELAANGCAVVFISSDLAEVCRVSDRVLVVHQGEVVADLPGHEATEDRVSALCFGLDDPALSAPSDTTTR
jgi:ABC-type sugar transport system ATPase subunit